MVGRDLIKAAELRSVLRDVQGYNAAASTFLAKYDNLPGDIPNAESY